MNTTATLSDTGSELRAKLGIKRYRDESTEHAKQYLTRLLMATGGDRVTAAAVAGLNRTHLQALIKRHSVKVPMNPKTRGRRKTKRSTQDSDADETRKVAASRQIDW